VMACPRRRRRWWHLDPLPHHLHRRQSPRDLHHRPAHSFHFAAAWLQGLTTVLPRGKEGLHVGCPEAQTQEVPSVTPACPACPHCPRNTRLRDHRTVVARSKVRISLSRAWVWAGRQVREVGLTGGGCAVAARRRTAALHVLLAVWIGRAPLTQQRGSGPDNPSH
jgi:hypothetical protein